ncbi:unnamed protein product [Gongylonema pulchrum]|uniref:Neur_chan_LBD domain-containing protein n=1 Tax=Gongylonema pulchrum TaxID=637853 RepID=A0A183DNB6_9BILA|nr:unnamed protein product [Gongylonema pulchrum]
MNVSYLLDHLIASHDRRIRPNYGGAPIEVNVTIHVTTISAISEVSMDYTVDLYLRQFWHDSRLAFESDDETKLTIGIDLVKSIWVPDTFFPNEKNVVQAQLFENVGVSFLSAVKAFETIPLLSRMKLFPCFDDKLELARSGKSSALGNPSTFPLDVQVCALEIEVSQHFHAFLHLCKLK